MITDTQRLYQFLLACCGNWRNSVYISTDGPGCLLSAGRDGHPIVMAVEQFQRLTGEIIDPAECCGRLTAASISIQNLKGMISMKRVNIKCPYCGSRALLRPASVVYGAKAADPAAPCYVCACFPACDPYVAAHRDTHLPMGTLANGELRRKRIEAHRAFGHLWESGLMTKKQAYLWLQAKLGLPEREALVRSSLAGIDKVVSQYIHTNEGVCGLGKDDLYQEGAPRPAGKLQAAVHRRGP